MHFAREQTVNPSPKYVPSKVVMKEGHRLELLEERKDVKMVIKRGQRIYSFEVPGQNVEAFKVYLEKFGGVEYYQNNNIYEREVEVGSFFSLWGRMTRRMYLLFVVLYIFAPILLFPLLFGGGLLIVIVLFPITLLPIFLATVKRLHDTDSSGAPALFIFASIVFPLIPFILLMMLWILMEPYSDLGGVNKYGENPRKSVEIRETLLPPPPTSW